MRWNFALRGIFTLALLAVTAPTLAYAQNGGGVFGPIVQEGHRLWDYRYTTELPSEGHRWAQRLHYEQESFGFLMWRFVGQFRDQGEGRDLEADFFRGEFFFDLGKPAPWWNTGLRFDATARNGSRPDQFNLNWTNQFDLGEQTIARFIVLSAREVGDRAADGVLLETRAMIQRRFSNGVNFGAEIYDPWGSTTDFGDFDQGRHQAGGFLEGPVGDIRVFGGVLFGLSESAPDLTIRTRFFKSF